VTLAVKGGEEKKKGGGLQKSGDRGRAGGKGAATERERAAFARRKGKGE